MNSKVSIIRFCLAVFMLAQVVPQSIAAESEVGSPTLQNNLQPSSSGDEPSISRRKASDLARQSFDGRVLSIRRDQNNWRVRMDRDGTVFNVFVNSSTGTVDRSSD